MKPRREHVPFDPYHFEKLERSGKSLSPQAVFQEIYRSRHWTGSNSVSGEGSGEIQTTTLKAELPVLLRSFSIESLLDLPCGDFSWMRSVELDGIRYIGADIVPELIDENHSRYAGPDCSFTVLDITRDPLPLVDLIFCRDCLVHLSFSDIWSALRTLKKSSITYFLTTTFPECEENEDIVTGDWRPLNLQKAPFNFPAPIQLLNEKCTEAGGLFYDKSLGLWLIRDIPVGE